jgi:hypothetical protein
MRPGFSGAILLWLLIGGTAGQAQRHQQATRVAVERAKAAIISQFDPLLPSLSLESFLEYETDGALVEWKAVACDSGKASAPGGAIPKRTCVDAFSDFDQHRSIDIVLAIPAAESELPLLLSVNLIEDGLAHPLKLIEIPVALHGGRLYKNRMIRDVLPLQRVS